MILDKGALCGKSDLASFGANIRSSIANISAQGLGGLGARFLNNLRRKRRNRLGWRPSCLEEKRPSGGRPGGLNLFSLKRGIRNCENHHSSAEKCSFPIKISSYRSAVRRGKACCEEAISSGRIARCDVMRRIRLNSNIGTHPIHCAKMECKCVE